MSVNHKIKKVWPYQTKVVFTVQLSQSSIHNQHSKLAFQKHHLLFVHSVLPGIKGGMQGRDGGERLAILAQQPSFKDSMALFDEMLVGRLHDLPAKPPSEVRIFLSSTFTGKSLLYS